MKCTPNFWTPIENIKISHNFGLHNTMSHDDFSTTMNHRGDSEFRMSDKIPVKRLKRTIPQSQRNSKAAIESTNTAKKWNGVQNVPLYGLLNGVQNGELCGPTSNCVGPCIIRYDIPPMLRDPRTISPSTFTLRKSGINDCIQIEEGGKDLSQGGTTKLLDKHSDDFVNKSSLQYELKFSALTSEIGISLEILENTTAKERELNLPSRISPNYKRSRRSKSKSRQGMKSKPLFRKLVPMNDLTTKVLSQIRESNINTSVLALDLRFLMVYMYEQHDDIVIFLEKDNNGRIFIISPTLYKIDDTPRVMKSNGTMPNKVPPQFDRSNSSCNHEVNTPMEESDTSSEHSSQPSLSIEFINVEHENKRVPRGVYDLLNVNTILDDSIQMSAILDGSQFGSVSSKENTPHISARKSVEIHQTENSQNINGSNVNSTMIAKERKFSVNSVEYKGNSNDREPNYDLIPNSYKINHQIIIPRNEFINKCVFQFLEWKQQQISFFIDMMKKHPNFLLHNFEHDETNINIPCPVCDFTFIFIKMPIKIHKKLNPEYMNNSTSKWIYPSLLKCHCANVYCRARFLYQIKDVPRSWIRPT